MTGVSLEENRTPVGEGDTILLYTDGVTEARSGNKFFGEGRTMRTLRYGGSPDSITRHLVDAVRRFASAEPRDDMAVVVVRMRGLRGTDGEAAHAVDGSRERE
jgi:sigma-B regulation protein RsbU (phosphoserine phosphatase)